jgi:uncharacterized protein (DUF433 family)
MNDQELLKRITVNPEIFGGKGSKDERRQHLHHVQTA